MRLKKFAYHCAAVVCAVTVVSCDFIDEEYRLDDVSKEVSLGTGTTTLPLGSFEKRYLGDLLGSGLDGVLDKTEDGSYSFSMVQDPESVGLGDFNLDELKSFTFERMASEFDVELPGVSFNAPAIEVNAQTAIDYAYKGIEICKKQNSDYILCMYHTLITFYTKLKRHEEVIKVYDMYFAVDEGIRKGIRSTDLDIIGFTANALYLLKRYDEAAEKYEKFFGLLDTVNKNKICTMDALYTTMRLTDGSSLDKVSIYYAASCLNTGRLREAENNIKNYPVSRFQYDSFLYNNRIRQAVFLLSKYVLEPVVKPLAHLIDRFEFANRENKHHYMLNVKNIS